MARKDPPTDPAAELRSVRLAELYAAHLAAVEARMDAGGADFAQTLITLGRIAACLASVERQEAQARAACTRAEREALRLQAEYARAERLLGQIDHPTPDEGDEMDMDDRPHRRDDPEYLAEIDRRIDQRFGDLARDLEAKGLLGHVLALAKAGDRDLVDVPLEPRAEAA